MKIAKITPKDRYAPINDIETNIRLIRQKKDGSKVIDDLGCNKIVNGAGLLLAQYCQNEGLPGITFMAIGTGNPVWPDPPPEPDVTQTELIAEVFRKVIMVRRYLDETFLTVPGPTRIIEMESTFMETEANVGWEEIALFGGTATAVLNSGGVFSIRNFRVKHKEDDEQVTIAWRLSF